MYSKKINQLATNLNPQSTDLIPIGDAETGQLKTTTYNLLSGVSSDGVISGGIVTWTGTGLVFNISACVYYLNGVRYSSPFSTKTLAAADPTNPRIDVFAVNTSGQVEVIQGTPAANPVEPEGDTPTTLGLTNVTIAAGATTPSGVTRDLIYDENVESWTKTFTQSASTVDYANTSFPNTGTKCILVTMGYGYAFLSFSKAVALDISNYKSLSFWIRLNAAWTLNQILSVQFYNGINLITNTYSILSTNTVGFNRNLAGTYQLITIPLDGVLLKFKSNAFTSIMIRTQNAAATYRLDTIQLNGGINNPIGGGGSANSFGFVNGSTGSAASTQATDTLNVVGTGLATTSASGKTLTIAVPSPIPSQTGNNGKYLTTDGSVLSWATVSAGNIYTQDGTLTSNRTLTLGGFSLTFAGSRTATGAIARGLYLNNTLVASANNDVLVGLDIIPTFTNGAFTGVNNIALRVGLLNTISRFGSSTIGGTSNGGQNGVTITTRTNGHGFITSFNYDAVDPSITEVSLGANFGFNGVTDNFYGIGVGSLRSTKYDIWFQTGNSNGGGYRFYKGITEMFTIFQNGNVGINTGSTNSGYRLDVNGIARISSDLTVNGVFRQTITTNRQIASYTLILADRGKLVEMNVATANNLTIPLNSSVAFPTGTQIDIAQYGAGQTTVVATGGVTIRSSGGALKLYGQYSAATLVKIGTDEWYLIGDITT